MGFPGGRELRNCFEELSQYHLGVTNQANIDGFLNMLVAAREAEVSRFVFAGSSSTYGDHPALPKIEDRIGTPLSIRRLVTSASSGLIAT